MANQQEQYLCVGICMADPDSGYCIGCGRPPFSTPDTDTAASEADLATPQPAAEPAPPA